MAILSTWEVAMQSSVNVHQRRLSDYDNTTLLLRLFSYYSILTKGIFITLKFRTEIRQKLMINDKSEGIIRCSSHTCMCEERLPSGIYNLIDWGYCCGKCGESFIFPFLPVISKVSAIFITFIILLDIGSCGLIHFHSISAVVYSYIPRLRKC